MTEDACQIVCYATSAIQLPRRADDPWWWHISRRTHRSTVFTAKEHERECISRPYRHQLVFEESTRPDLLASDVYRHPSLRRNMWCVCNLRLQATCRVDGHYWDPRPTRAESRGGFVLVVWKGLCGNSRLPRRFLQVRLPIRDNIRNRWRTISVDTAYHTLVSDNGPLFGRRTQTFCQQQTTS